MSGDEAQVVPQPPETPRGPEVRVPRRDRWRAATQTLAGAAIMITVITVLSRLVGFGRSLAQAAFVGTEGVGGAFSAANQLPNVLFEVAAGGALAGAVVPLLAGPIARRAGVQTSRTASAFLGWTLVVLVPLALVVVLLAHPLAVFLTDGDPSLVPVVAAFLRVFALQVPLYGVAVVLGGILQAHKRFFWQAFAPLVSSVAVIVVFVVFGFLADGQQGDPAALSTAAFDWLAWGTTAAVAFLAFPLVLPVRRAGVRLRPTLRFPDGEGRRAARLAFAGIGALVAQQASVVAVMRASYTYGPESTFPTYFFAQQVYLLPYAVLAFPLATSALPRLAEHVAHGRREAFGSLLAGTTRALLVVSAAGAAALVAAAPAVEATFAAFTTGTVEGLGAAVATMAGGLVGFALILHLSRALYVIDRQRAAVVATASGWLVVGAAAFALPAWGGASEQADVLALLGLATTLGMSVAGLLLLLAVHRHAGAGALSGVPRTTVVLLVGTGLGALAGIGVTRALLPEQATLLAALGTGTLAAVVAVVVVLGSALLGDRAALGAVLRRGRAAKDDAGTRAD